MQAWKHLKTITYHKWLVMKGCFQVGLFKQGILHDMSKYSPAEFFVCAKYYQGHRSPNDAERESLGYSSAWLHHKGRNKHHYEYWVDYSTKASPRGIAPIQMPEKYVVEMLMDRIAACKVYGGDQYNDRMPLEYFLRGKDKIIMHEKTKEQLELLLRMLEQDGEKKTFSYIKKKLLHGKNMKQS